MAAKPATPTQLRYLGRLRRDINELASGRVPEGLPPLDDVSSLSSAQASARIQELTAIRDGLFRRNGTRVLRKLTAGFYEHDNKVYRVQPTKNGRNVYAMRAEFSAGKPKGFVYDKGAVYHLLPAERMEPQDVLEFAASFGPSSGKCVVCDAKLTAGNTTGLDDSCAQAT